MIAYILKSVPIDFSLARDASAESEFSDATVRTTHLHQRSNSKNSANIKISFSLDSSVVSSFIDIFQIPLTGRLL